MKCARLVALISFILVISGGTTHAQGIPPAVVRVHFEVQPSDTALDAAMDPPVVIRVMGGADAPLPGAAVQIQVVNNPYNSSLTGNAIHGVTGTDGRAIFHNLTFTRPGADVRLNALVTVSGLSGDLMTLNTSNTFSVIGEGSSVDSIGPRAWHIFTLRIPAGECPHPNPVFASLNCDNSIGDTLPPGNMLYYLFSIFDTGSSAVWINNSVEGSGISDADLLNLCVPEGDCSDPPVFLPSALGLRTWGLGAVDPDSFGAPLDTPQAEVERLKVKLGSTSTLVGAPLAARFVTHIDYTTTVVRDFDFGTLVAPDITFFEPGETGIPTPHFEVGLYEIGGFLYDGDVLATGPRFLAEGAIIRNGAEVADDSEFGFLVDTGNTTTQVNEIVAETLGIDPATDPPVDELVVDTLEGPVTLRGYVVDSFELKSVDGNRELLLLNPLLYVAPSDGGDPADTFQEGVDVVLGSNYFAHTRILFDGPRARLGLFDGYLVDVDGDGADDIADNCPSVYNPGQADQDNDGVGDACDPDSDGDGVNNDIDNCPADPNASQLDSDGDTFGNACDPCPFDEFNDVDVDGVCGNVDNCPDDANPGQEDNDGDGIGDACDPDDDDDGLTDVVDSCPFDPNPDNLDIDGDGVADVCDPCPADPLDECDSSNSAGESIGSAGGDVEPESGNVTVSVPPGALDEETSISVTESGGGAIFEMVSDLGGGPAIFQVTVHPAGTVFNQPITVTFRWPDGDPEDGIVDETAPAIDELDLLIVKDGVAITGECRVEPACNPETNAFSVQVTSLSDFALFMLDCPEFQIPESQGHWHRQCKRFGTDRYKPTESDFVEELVPCADAWLEALGFSSTDTCDGMNADPANDECEKALKKLTTMVLNVCSDRLGAGCLVDVSAYGCTAPTVGLLMDEIAQMIHSGDCKEAKICASVFD